MHTNRDIEEDKNLLPAKNESVHMGNNIIIITWWQLKLHGFIFDITISVSAGSLDVGKIFFWTSED